MPETRRTTAVCCTITHLYGASFCEFTSTFGCPVPGWNMIEDVYDRVHLMPGPKSSTSRKILLMRHATDSSKSPLLVSLADTSLLRGGERRHRGWKEDIKRVPRELLNSWYVCVPTCARVYCLGVRSGVMAMSSCQSEGKTGEAHGRLLSSKSNSSTPREASMFRVSPRRMGHYAGFPSLTGHTAIASIVRLRLGEGFAI